MPEGGQGAAGERRREVEHLAVWKKEEEKSPRLFLNSASVLSPQPFFSFSFLRISPPLSLSFSSSVLPHTHKGACLARRPRGEPARVARQGPDGPSGAMHFRGRSAWFSDSCVAGTEAIWGEAGGRRGCGGRRRRRKAEEREGEEEKSDGGLFSCSFLSLSLFINLDRKRDSTHHTHSQSAVGQARTLPLLRT